MSPPRQWIVAPALAVLLLGAGCGDDGAKPPPSPGPAASAAVSPDFNDADLVFVRGMLPRERTGVGLAELGAKRAATPEARTLAAAIVATQRDEIKRLESWLVLWKQPVPPAATAEPGVAALKATPKAEFDRRFAELLIAQQDAAAKLGQQVTGEGRNPNARAFGRQVVESRTAQIDQLRAYLK